MTQPNPGNNVIGGPKKECKLFDLSFYGDASSSRLFAPKNISWHRGGEGRETNVFTDLCLPMVDVVDRAKKTVAWLIEPVAINPQPSLWVLKNAQKFDLILTHHKDFPLKGEKVQYYAFGGCWVAEQDWSIYPKSKGISIIASGKNYTIGHAIRHRVVRECRDQMDVYGSGYRPVQDKIDALRDYMFSVTIENSSVRGYFTEKLIDCFVTGTVPIYWGDKDISEHFNTDGVLVCTTEDEMVKVVKVLSDPVVAQEYYNRAARAIADNYKIAQEYVVAEDRFAHLL